MDFVARPPRHPSLEGVVRMLWEARSPGASRYETRLPSATTQLLLNLAADHLARLDRSEASLVQRVAANGRSPDGLVREALRRMQAGATEIGSIASTLGVTARRLRRRFCAELGLPPKPMVRVIRFQRALDALATELPLTDVALAAGYFDQAHLGHEFNTLSGMSPGRYRETSPAMRHHV